jgi:hypothetical protein
VALDDETRTGRDGSVLPLDLSDGDRLVHHGLGGSVVEFVEYTGEVALPRKGGAVVRFAFVSASEFWGGVTDTAVAGELSQPHTD